MQNPISVHITVAAALLLLPFESVDAADSTHTEWIWGPSERHSAEVVRLFREFDLKVLPARANLRGVADFCHARVYVNGERVATSRPFDEPVNAQVQRLLRAGTNIVTVSCIPADGPSAVFLDLQMQFDDGREQTIATDNTWKWMPTAATPDRADIDLTAAKRVASFGRVAAYPWGTTTDTVTVNPFDDYTQWKRAQTPGMVPDPATFQVPDGFQIDLIRPAAEDEGSWVGMAFDPHGRLVIAKEDVGLLRLTLPNDERGEMRVETIDRSLHECRGLLFAHGSLYAMANNDKMLVRLRDIDGDDHYEKLEIIKSFAGSVGHGRNEITLGPDGKIYCIFGDAVVEPDDVEKRVPRLSHPSAAECAPSGFLARTDATGRRWDILARGLRNPFGIAFNTDGEAFTYDADAEYDMGTPWYRPTRIVHLAGGADFGWRAVTKQWPPYVPDRPDMPRPTLDIGKGSPTAVTFGTNSNFPHPYRNALFALDWAYGRMLAVHLTPRGSSYAAKAETFLRGRPANVTDVEFGPDGAMYFVTGGRGTQSALYRVRYVGPEIQPPAKTAQQQARERHSRRARELRHKLESLHGRRNVQPFKTAHAHLGSDDPWIRHAARVAYEWLPRRGWPSLVIRELEPTTALTVLLARVRGGAVDQHSEFVRQVNQFTFSELNEEQKLTALFIYERCLNGGRVAADDHESMRRQLDPHFPDESPAVNLRLSLLLKRLTAPRLVERCLALLEQAENQQERMHYLFVLRDVASGWTEESRRVYFKHLTEMSTFVGGEGMPGFRRLIEQEALATVPEAQRPQFAKLLEQSHAELWSNQMPDEPRETVREWTLDDLAGALGEVADNRDFKRGARLYAVAKCIACHRIAGRGGTIGPDLSSVSGRFSPRDLLTSIVEPSKVVAEPYRRFTFVLDDGRIVEGQVLPGNDYRSPNLKVATDPLDPTKVVEFAKEDIAVRKPSDVSPMPKGLLNVLSREEILDLLAYVIAGGDARHTSFRSNTE